MYQNFQQYLKTLRILHIAISIGALLVAIVLYNFVGGTANSENFTFFSYVIAAVWTVVVAMNLLFWGPRIQKLVDGKSLNDKLLEYRKWFIVHCALYNGAAYIILICVFFTEVPMLLLTLAAISWLLLLLLFPSEDKILTAINPNTNEAIQLKSGENVVFIPHDKRN